MPATYSISCCIKIQIVLTFWYQLIQGSSGKMAVKMV